MEDERALNDGFQGVPTVGRHLTCQRSRDELQRARNATRWSTTLSSKVNLSHTIDLRASCGANLVT